jgi:hypothetical protein
MHDVRLPWTLPVITSREIRPECNHPDHSRTHFSHVFLYPWMMKSGHCSQSRDPCSAKLPIPERINMAIMARPRLVIDNASSTRGRRNSFHHNLRRNLAELGNCCSCTQPLLFHHTEDLMAFPSEFARVLHREGISAIRARTSCIAILLHSSCKISLS